jgi:hypothetical protein
MVSLSGDGDRAPGLCIGFFLYLMYVLAVGFLLAHIKVSAPGFLATLGRAAFQLGRETLASISSARNGEMDFKAMVGNDLGSVWTRIGALATLHGPGSLMYCFVINRYICKPFTGRGILLAAVVVLITLPLGWLRRVGLSRCIPGDHSRPTARRS